MKRKVRLTECDLHRIIKESVKRVLIMNTLITKLMLIDMRKSNVMTKNFKQTYTVVRIG